MCRVRRESFAEICASRWKRPVPLASSSSSRLPTRLQKKVVAAVRVLDELMTKRDSSIPTDLIDDAQCIAVLPSVGKGAFVVGGRYGKGLVSCRLGEKKSWSAPAFIQIGGASIGLQFGGEAIDLVLVVRNQEGLEHLLRNNVTLGADASVAAGPVGRTAGAATDAAMRASILSYSRSRGAFAGAALDGAVVKQDPDDNALLYGRRVEGSELLMPKGTPVAVPAAVKPFIDALGRHARSAHATEHAEHDDKK